MKTSEIIRRIDMLNEKLEGRYRDYYGNAKSSRAGMIAAQSILLIESRIRELEAMMVANKRHVVR